MEEVGSPAPGKGCQCPWAAQELLHRFVSEDGDLGETWAQQGGTQRQKGLGWMESLSQQCGWDDGLGTAQGVEGAWQAGLAPPEGWSQGWCGSVRLVHQRCAQVCLLLSPWTCTRHLHHTDHWLSRRKSLLNKSRESGVTWTLQNVAGRVAGLLSSSEWQLHNGNLCLSAAGRGPGSRDKGDFCLGGTDLGLELLLWVLTRAVTSLLFFHPLPGRHQSQLTQQILLGSGSWCKIPLSATWILGRLHTPASLWRCIFGT